MDYPIFLTGLQGWKCVVVGGGEVAQRKVNGLLAVGAHPTVVAPEATAEIIAKAADDRLTWLPRPVCREDLRDAMLVFAATDDEDVNRDVAAWAKEAGSLVNVADQQEACDFTLPAMLRRGKLTIAVSSGGASPALAAIIRDRLALLFPEELADKIEQLAAARFALQRSVTSPVERHREARELGNSWARRFLPALFKPRHPEQE